MFLLEKMLDNEEGNVVSLLFLRSLHQMSQCHVIVHWHEMSGSVSKHQLWIVQCEICEVLDLVVLQNSGSEGKKTPVNPEAKTLWFLFVMRSMKSKQ